MKHSKNPLITITAILGALAGGPSLHSADPKPPQIITVAVLDFESKDGTGAAASALLTAALSGSEFVHLVERADLTKILAEGELSLTSQAGGNEAMKIGHLTGAKAIVTGRIFSAGGRDYLVGKCIGTETGRVFGHSVDYEAGGDFTVGIDQLSKSVVETLTKKQGDLLAKVESPEERIARLRQGIAGKKLPAVFVSISEQHLSRPVPDPAAQVEIQKTLQDLGFPLVDRAGDAAVVVSGEAFSEMAGRHGNLVACRARLEVKVSTASSKEIQVDRETSVALDLAEHIAAKSALQEAGRRVSERILKQITTVVP